MSRTRPTIAELQTELDLAKNETRDYRFKCAQLENQRDQKEAERARAVSELDFQSVEVISLKCEVARLEGRIEGIKLMLDFDGDGHE